MAAVEVPTAYQSCSKSENLLRNGSEESGAFLESHDVVIYLENLSLDKDSFSVSATKALQADEIIQRLFDLLGLERSKKLGLPRDYELVEATTSGGTICLERRLPPTEHPLCLQLLWPRVSTTVDGELYQTGFRFVLRPRLELPGKSGGKTGQLLTVSSTTTQIQHYLSTLIQHPADREYQVTTEFNHVMSF